MTRNEILTAKINLLQKKFEHKALIVKNIEDNALLNEKQRLDLEQLNETLTTEKIELAHEIARLKDKLQNSITKNNFNQLQKEREKLIEDLTSTRAAMLSYKKMTEFIAE